MLKRIKSEKKSMTEKKIKIEEVLITAQHIQDIKAKHLDNIVKGLEKITDPVLKLLLTDIAAAAHYESRLNRIEHSIMQETLTLLKDPN
jgi:hypothetical protein